MNLVDSSGWLSYLLDEPNADRFAPAIVATDSLVVPSIVIFEVYRHLRRFLGIETAVRAVSPLQDGTGVDLTQEIALLAGELGRRHDLPLADSVILASARSLGAILWTQDSDFEGLEHVEYIPRR
ncbi:MAG: type II toxin-antitoxin system VapC family toxin [marine benthic group bacterium]|nr:type II toxin-antitoxin system VapC family toxin [Gemmatimonadota bacterium]